MNREQIKELISRSTDLKNIKSYLDTHEQQLLLIADKLNNDLDSISFTKNELATIEHACIEARIKIREIGKTLYTRISHIYREIHDNVKIYPLIEQRIKALHEIDEKLESIKLLIMEGYSWEEALREVENEETDN